MRGVETRIQEIRHKIFTEVARMAYHTEWPVKIVWKLFHTRLFLAKKEISGTMYFGACYSRRETSSGNGSALP